MTKLLMVMFVGLSWVSQARAHAAADIPQNQGVILHDVPQKIDKNGRYLFYISGYIVQAGNPRPTSPKFGVYEYEEILETFKQNNFIVISEASKQSPEIEPYAAKVAAQVRQLLQAGVPPQNITAVGASQGGWIAMLASTYLKNRRLNFVAIGACAADDGLLRVLDFCSSAQTEEEWPPLSYLRNDYKAVSVVVHVLIREAEITGRVGGYENWKIVSEVVEPFKGRFRKGDVIEYFQGAEAGLKKDYFKGEKIVFLLADADSEKKALRYTVLENSTLQHSADRVRKLRFLRRSYTNRRSIRHREKYVSVVGKERQAVLRTSLYRHLDSPLWTSR